MSTTEEYLRRYLNDPSVLPTKGPPITPPVQPETDLTKYYRRYLNDPKGTP